MWGSAGTVALDAHTTLLNVCICSFMAAVFGFAAPSLPSPSLSLLGRDVFSMHAHLSFLPV